MGNNGRQSAIASHPHGPRIVDGKLLVSGPPAGPVDLGAILAALTVKLDVLAVGLDVLVDATQANGAKLDRIAGQLERAVVALEAFKLPTFLTGKR